jgi:hypothetical protein
LYRRWNKKSGDREKMVLWRYELEMSFLLPSLYTKNTHKNVHDEENLEAVKIDEQETYEPEMNTYELQEGQSNITFEETSSSYVDSHAQGYFPMKRKQQGRDSAIVRMVVMKENSYLRQRRREEKTPIWDMDVMDMVFLSMAKIMTTFFS